MAFPGFFRLLVPVEPHEWARARRQRTVEISPSVVSSRILRAPSLAHTTCRRHIDITWGLIYSSPDMFLPPICSLSNASAIPLGVDMLRT